jgi:glycosyltransferase involved in cell wall biosynthesis
VVIVRALLTAYGGAEHAAALHAAGLKRRGYDVSFLARPPLDTAHPYYTTMREASVRVVAPPRWSEHAALRALARAVRPALLPPYLMMRPKTLPEAWRSLEAIADTALHRLEQRQVLRALAPRGGERVIVHIYGQEGMTPFIVRWAAARRVPVVYTESGEADAVYVERFGLQPTIDVINQIPLVVCCGPGVAESIRRVYGYRGPIEEIPFLIEDPISSPLPVGPGSSDPGRVILGTVGRLVEHKGHHEVVRAAAVLRDEGYDVGVVIGGDGPMMPGLGRLATELGLGDRVQLLGRFGEVAEVMARIDVFVLPSTSEGQPLAITEAMAHGKPIVSTRFGGIPDLVEDGRTGLLITPGSHEELLQALRRIVADDEGRREMGERGRQAYLATRRSDLVLDRIEAAYQRLLGTTAGHRRGGLDEVL